MKAPFWLLVAACTPKRAEVVDVDGDPVPKQEWPLAGGRATSGENWHAVVASDEEGDRVVVQPLNHDGPESVGEEENLPSELRLPLGWAPGAISMVLNQTVAVAAQGVGSIVFFHTVPELGLDVVAPVCPEPRDVQIVPDSTIYAWVACGDGRLVQVGSPSGETLKSWFVAPDLAHLFVEGVGDAFVATATGDEVLRVDLTTGEIVNRFALPSAGDGNVAVRRIVHADWMAVYVLHEDGSKSMVTRIGRWDDTMTSLTIDATEPLDMLSWFVGDDSSRIPTPVVAAADIGAGPGVRTFDPLGGPDDVRELYDRFSVVPTDAPAVGVALGVWGPIAVTRDPFTIVSSMDGAVFTLFEGDR